jgi:hypothetical protein
MEKTVYTAQCPHCGETWLLHPESEGYDKAVAHHAAGFIDAVCLPEQCANCADLRERMRRQYGES